MKVVAPKLIVSFIVGCAIPAALAVMPGAGPSGATGPGPRWQADYPGYPGSNDATPTPGGYPGSDPTPTPAGYPGGNDPTPTPDGYPGSDPTPTPVATPHVDAMIRNGDGSNATQTYCGDNIYNTDGTDQTKSQVTVPGLAAVYSIQVQNKSNSSSQISVQSPNVSAGWSAHYFDAVTDGNDITAQVTGSDGWATPALDPGANYTIRLEVTPDTTIVDGATEDVSVTATLATDTTKIDVVKASTTRLKQLSKLQYSLNSGATWADAPPPGSPDAIAVTAGYVFGLRAIALHPAQAWPDFHPVWTNQGVHHYGNEIWVLYDQPSDAVKTVTAECGDTLAVKIQVLAAP